MAITDHASAVAAIADTINRQDLTSVIPLWITLLEADLNRDTTLRVPAMAKRATIAANGSEPLPTDFLQFKDIRCTDTSRTLEYLPPDVFNEYAFKGITGVLRYYTIVGAQIDFLPTPSSATPANVEIHYWAKIPALLSGANWLVAKAPDLYLYGALMHSAPYLSDDARLATWKSARDMIVNQLKLDGDAALRPDALRARRKRSY